jgi:hypothetical protein
MRELQKGVTPRPRSTGWLKCRSAQSLATEELRDLQTWVRKRTGAAPPTTNRASRKGGSPEQRPDISKARLSVSHVWDLTRHKISCRAREHVWLRARGCGDLGGNTSWGAVSCIAWLDLLVPIAPTKHKHENGSSEAEDRRNDKR